MVVIMEFGTDCCLKGSVITHQLFMRQKGTFVLMFNGKIDFSVPLKYDEQDETTECKLVSDFLNLIFFAHLTRRVT
jgi:hypothetical protein